MPAPIVLRNLTPETKIVPNPPAGEPVIATRSDLRDGTRSNSNSGGGGGAAPSLPDGAYDMSAMTYLGAFRIDRSEGGFITDNYNRSSFGFRPSDGSTNGAFGSVYIDSHVYTNNIGEFDIPSSLGQGDDIGQLPNAVNLQPFSDIRSRAPISDTNGSDRIGYIGMVNGKLHVSFYNTYDNNGNVSNLLIVDDPKDLSGSPIQGFMPVEGADKTSLYLQEVPDEYKASLGGDYLMGMGGDMSIVTRTSLGPSLYTFSVSDLSPPSQLPTVAHMVFSVENNLTQGAYPPPSDATAATTSTWDTCNEATTRHYEAQIGMTFAQWRDGGMTPEWETLTPPDPSIVNDMWPTDAKATFGFIVPGTKTFLALGTMTGRRYGGSYKVQQAGKSSETSGYAPLFEDDQDHWFWAFNVDDILGAANPYDPQPYDRGVFANNRWLRPSRWDITDGQIKGGHYDASNDRLYLSHHYESKGYTTTVVSVYSLGVQ